MKRRHLLARVSFTVLAIIVPALMTQANAQLTPALRAYANSWYSYCDAKKVAHVWKQNVGDAKTTIGNKILGNIEHLVDADIASTKNIVRCNWSEAGLEFADAERLSRYWGISIEQAKQKVEEMTSEMGTKKFRTVMGAALYQG